MLMSYLTNLYIIGDKFCVLSHVLQKATRRADHDVAGADAIPLILQVLPPYTTKRGKYLGINSTVNDKD